MAADPHQGKAGAEAPADRDLQNVEEVESLLCEAKIHRSDLLHNEPGLRFGLDLIRLDSARGLLRLAAVILFPLLIFTAVTLYEGRFGLGSVTWLSGELGSRRVRGMSFLGDTMVWPFVILIPLLFVLLNKALDRFEAFFESIQGLLSRSWLIENSEEYLQIVERTRSIVRTEGGWRYTRQTCVAVGLVFFAVNTIVCSYPEISIPYLDYSVVPYTTNQPWVKQPDTCGSYQEENLAPCEKIPVPKWDADIESAWWSWLSARVWVLFLGYVWIPVVIHKLFNLVLATYIYTSRLATHQRALEVKPLSPDNVGGLSKLASLATALTYPMVVVGIMMAMPFIKENTTPSLHNMLLFIPFAPLFFSFFFLPLLGVHRAMSAAKEKYLREFADLFNNVQARFLGAIREPSLDAEEFQRLEISMRGLSETYGRIEKMPVWPFEISTLYRLFTAVLIPVLVPICLDLLARRFLQ